MSPINVFEIAERMREEFERGYCSHPGASPIECKGGIAKAHTVQRRGGLAAVAEAGHVLTVKPTMKALEEHDGRPPPRRIGIGLASVFPGFCNHHDSALFKLIEGDDLTLSADEAFLLCFRAVAYERFAKASQLETHAILRQMDKGAPFEQQVAVQTYLHGLEWSVRRGLADAERWKAAYDRRLLSGVGEDFHFVAIRFAAALPVVACGAFHAEVDLAGNLLQRLTRGEFALEHVALNITVYRGRTVAVIGWIGSSCGPAAAFAQSFQALPDDRKADALVRIAFEQSDNIFIRPSWWENLQADQRKRLINQSLSGTPSSPRRHDCLVDRGSNFATAKVLEQVVA